VLFNGKSYRQMQQREIACAVGLVPQNIIPSFHYSVLDEPTSHLDIGNQMKVLNMLRKLADDGYGVVMTTHNPDHVLLLDEEVAVLDRSGNLTFGMSRDILDEELLSEFYGTSSRMFDIHELGRKVCVAESMG
jgi:iron complex transport system ATP-binding protein